MWPSRLCRHYQFGWLCLLLRNVACNLYNRTGAYSLSFAFTNSLLSLSPSLSLSHSSKQEHENRRVHIFGVLLTHTVPLAIIWKESERGRERERERPSMIVLYAIRYIKERVFPLLATLSVHLTVVDTANTVAATTTTATTLNRFECAAISMHSALCLFHSMIHSTLTRSRQVQCGHNSVSV